MFRTTLSSGERWLICQSVDSVPDARMAEMLRNQLNSQPEVYREVPCKQTLLVNRNMFGLKRVRPRDIIKNCPAEFTLSLVTFRYKGKKVSATIPVISGQLFGIVFSSKDLLGLNKEDISELNIISLPYTEMSTSPVDLAEQLKTRNLDIPATWIEVLGRRRAFTSVADVFTIAGMTSQEVEGTDFVQLFTCGDWVGLCDDSQFYLYDVVNEIRRGPFNIDEFEREVVRLYRLPP